MAIFGGKRDISMLRHINRELLWDVITQQCAFYKLRVDQTTFNIYGEASGDKFYSSPVLINCLIERGDQAFEETEFGTDLSWDHNFRILNDDLILHKLLPQIGDIIMYENKFYEVYNIKQNQLFLGKDPNYDNETQPESYSPPNAQDIGLGDFGWNVSTICYAHYVPKDKVGIINERII